MLPRPVGDSESHFSASNESPKGTNALSLETHPAAGAAASKRRFKFSISRKDSKAQLQPVPFWTLYRYADKWDILFIILGIIGAIGNG